jgi:uncharacterized protein (DUF302 family)
VEGLVLLTIRDGPAETLKRLEASIAAHGLEIFARIDHAEGARRVGLELRPTEVVIFGSPKAGTPLMRMSETLAVDLPLKIMIWQGANGETRLAWDDPAWIARRHGLGPAADPIVAKMRAAIDAVARDAASGTA